MSYYFNYYIGYEKGNKIYPLGPYGLDGKLKAVLVKSRSYASDLRLGFDTLAKDKISEELKKDFEYKDWNNQIVCPNIRWLPIDRLPTGSFIKKGYFLIDDIQMYESRGGDSEDLFFDSLPPEVYAESLKNEILLGKPEPELDCEGEPMPVRSAREYMYYAYPDYNSSGYEAMILREMAEVLADYSLDDFRLVVLLTEG